MNNGCIEMRRKMLRKRRYDSGRYVRLTRRGIASLAFVTGLYLTAAFAEPLIVEAIAAREGSDQRTGQPIVSIKLKESGAFFRFTTENVGREMELRVDDKVIWRNIIREPVMGGSFQISGISMDEARALAALISTPGARLEVDIVPK